MRGLQRSLWSAAVLGLCSLPLSAQAPPAAPAATAVAATVNGQPIPEVAVQRCLQRVPPNRHKDARPEFLNYLIDNVVIDQYLQQLQVTVDPKEVDKRIAETRAEMEKMKKDFAKVLQEMQLTEAELREHITADLRWDKFAESRATDAVLRDLFDKQRYLFDGSQVRARHILLTVPANDPKAAEEALKQIQDIRTQIEQKVAEEVAKVPADSDNLAREKARATALEKNFAELAKARSSCPSGRERGGDVGWFQGIGFMVEPFSRAAFALKPYQLSDVVKTQFGYHLILPVDRKAGKEVKFEDVKEMVKEYYCANLRDSLARQARERSKIVITPTR